MFHITLSLYQLSVANAIANAIYFYFLHITLPLIIKSLYVKIMTKDRGGDFMPLPILTALRAAGIIAAGATGSLPLALIAGAVTEAMVSTETDNSGESETKTAEAPKKLDGDYGYTYGTD
mgnify:CR=1 FL=1